MSPALSVMTPVYNGAAFIDRCYFMLRRQTFTDWEWVVVNDGSTDETESRVRALDDPRIRLIGYRQNRGRGFARNEALRAARGDWLVVWDIDDVYFPDRLEKVNQARLEGYDFCCSYTILLDNDLSIDSVRGFTKDDAGRMPMFVHGASACRTGLDRKIGYHTELPAGEDFALVYRLAHHHHGKWIEDALFAYQHRNDINPAKSLQANIARRSTYEFLRRRKLLGFDDRTYWRIMRRLRHKALALRAFHLCPSLYRQTVRFRASGKVDPNWSLSAERQQFLEEVRARHQTGDWKLGVNQLRSRVA